MQTIYDITRRSRAPMQTGVKPVTNQGSYRTPAGIAAPPQQSQQENPSASAVKLGGILGKAYKDWNKMKEEEAALQQWGNEWQAARGEGQPLVQWTHEAQQQALQDAGITDAGITPEGSAPAAGTVPGNTVPGQALPDAAGSNAALGDAALGQAAKADLGAIPSAGSTAGNASALADTAALGSAEAIPGTSAANFGGLLGKFNPGSGLGELANTPVSGLGELAQAPVEGLGELANAAGGAADAAQGAASSLPGVGQIMGAASAGMNLANGDYLNAGLDAAKTALLAAGPYGWMGSLGIQAGQTLGDLTGWW